MVSNDVVFNEQTFPLRDNIHNDPADLWLLNDDVWDDIWNIPNIPCSVEPSNNPVDNIPPTEDQRPTACTTRQRIPVSQLGNLIVYHASTKTSIKTTPRSDDDKDKNCPKFSEAMRGPHRDDWFQAMSKEFSALQAHGVDTLAQPPANANILPGMWRLKRKQDEFGRITTYKAIWVAGGNHQIQGIDFESTYASVGLTDTLQTLYPLAAEDDIEMQSFDIKTAFLNGNMSHDDVRQVTGFCDP